MPNIYDNQSRNIPTIGTKMVLGQKVVTNYGIGTIVNIVRMQNNYFTYGIPPALVATIVVPANYPNPVIIFNQTYSDLVFTNGVNGELPVNRTSNNL